MALFFTTNRFFSEAVNKMEHCQNWMAVGHPGAWVFHHCFNLFSHSRLVAMYFTVCACCFACLERTPVETPFGIIKKLPAVRAESIMCLMMIMAIDFYHDFNSIFFPCHSLVFIKHDEYVKRDQVLQNEDDLLHCKRPDSFTMFRSCEIADEERP